LIAVAVAMIITVDPLGLRLNHMPEAKHLPLLLSVPAFVLTLCGRRLGESQSESVLSRTITAAWPLALLALFIIVGSVYVRVLHGVRETLLNVGLYIPFTFVAAAMVLASKAPEALVRAYFKILLVGGGAMGVLVAVDFLGRSSYRAEFIPYHNEIFLVIPLAVYCALALKTQLARIAGTMFFLSIAVFSAKNTSYLTALLVLIYLGYGFWLPRLLRTNPLKRFSGFYLIFVIVLGIAALIMFLFAFREAYLPSGNPVYRLHAYEVAWNRFLDSPLWGTAFADRAVEKFTLYEIAAAGGILPTHSDIMDLLAHGGLIGIGLWLYGLFVVARAARRLLRPANYEHPWTPYAHAFAVLSLASVLVYAFNPILASPSVAYFVWSNVGFLLGLSLHAEAAPATIPTPPRPIGRYKLERF
jgi:hypothetical protein